MRRLVGALVREGALTVGLLLGASLLVFAIVRAAPGDAALALGLGDGRRATASAVEEYLRWLGGALTGDLGVSLRTGRPVADEIRRVGGNTLALAVGALAVTVSVAVPIGAVGALRRGVPAALATLAAYALSALPAFFVGYVAIYVFTRKLDVFPLAFGGDGRMPWLAFVLPMLVLGVANGGVGEVVRHVRTALERVLAEDYVRTARAKGAPVWRHAAAEGLVLPVTAALAAKVPFVLGGAVVVEQVFNWPGLGRLAWQAALDRDYPVIMGLALLAAVAARAAALAASVAQAALAPGARPGTEVDRPLVMRVPWPRPAPTVGRTALVLVAAAQAALAAGCATARPAEAPPVAPGARPVEASAPPPVTVRLPAGWRTLGADELRGLFPHRSETADTLLAAASESGRFVVLVAADPKASLVAFARREGLAGLREALDRHVPGFVQAFRRVDAIEGGLAGRPALYYRFTGVAASAPQRGVGRFAMELIVVPTERVVYTVSLLDLTGDTRFDDPALEALKASVGWGPVATTVGAARGPAAFEGTP
ncbi:MAG TPA: ABC transporter permease [Thermodesulfobacteriota bacterium]